MVELSNWVPEDYIKLSIPLTEKIESNHWILHYYSGFNPALASIICDKYINPISSFYNIVNPVNIYLYVIDYAHNYSSELNRKNCNNGYMQRVGNDVTSANYSIVIFRKLFWPKVLLHEIFHILWQVETIPHCISIPKYDEALVEYYAVNIAQRNGYINEPEYKYWLKQSQNTIINNVMPTRNGPFSSMGLTGGSYDKFMNEFKKRCLETQKTHVYEYLFMSQDLQSMANS